MPTATLHDGSRIDIVVAGDGPTVLLPVNPTPVEGPQADAMRQFGADPALGRRLVDGLSAVATVVAFDYEGQCLANPKPATLTPDAIAADVLAVADAAGVERFAWYGYSWLGMAGIQVALRTDRLTGLAVGGFPPLDAPYAELLQVTRAGLDIATGTGGPDDPDDPWAGTSLSAAQTRQFVTLYEALTTFDDRAAQARITCPRLVLAGTADEVVYGPQWGDVTVSIGERVARARAELGAGGWQVHLLEGLDHMSAMQADPVLPILRPWVSTLPAVLRA
jgi:pimeloyl-ACP methyl ester carboxylesterase